MRLFINQVTVWLGNLILFSAEELLKYVLRVKDYPALCLALPENEIRINLKLVHVNFSAL